MEVTEIHEYGEAGSSKSVGLRSKKHGIQTTGYAVE